MTQGARREYVDVRRVGPVLVLTMNDPATRNAMSSEMAGELGQELDLLESDPDLRVLLLTGRDPSFCSGANVRRMEQANEPRRSGVLDASSLSAWERLEQAWTEGSATPSADEIELVRSLPLRIYKLQKPSIAAVNGHAMGLGMGVALSCDIRIASDEARFAEAFVKNGLVPADGSCWQLPRMIGIGNTLLLQYTGDVIAAEESLRLGIVSLVAPHEELMGAAMDLAQRLARGATYAMALTKRLVQRSLTVDLEESMRVAGAAQDIARQTEDHREGVRAFIEKRRPNFKGR